LEQWLSAHLGRPFTGPSRAVTQDDIMAFADISGDRAPIHVNPEYAAGTEYGTVIAHGLLTLSLAATLVSEARPFRGLVSYGYDSIRFVAPVRAGDILAATGEIVSAQLRGPDYALVGVTYRAVNQDETVVLACTHQMLCRTEQLTGTVPASPVSG
jgi:3-hydroxybutyryl-CoA dehydratase